MQHRSLERRIQVRVCLSAEPSQYSARCLLKIQEKLKLSIQSITWEAGTIYPFLYYASVVPFMEHLILHTAWKADAEACLAGGGVSAYLRQAAPN